MKRIISKFNRSRLIGLAVVIMAVSLSGFTKHVETEKNKNMGMYYWFLLDPVSGIPMTNPKLIYQSGDPWWCSFIGLGYYCAGAFSAYTQDIYGYHASGYFVLVHYYLL
jgi:hypothetical protein